MADTFKVRGTYPVTETLGGTKTRNMVAVGAVTVPHGVYFEVRVPQADYTASLTAAALLGPASIYEDLFDIPGVVDVAWSQGATASGQLQDLVTVVVSSTSGDSSDELTVPFVQLGPQLHKPQIAALRAQLDATEAL